MKNKIIFVIFNIFISNIVFSQNNNDLIKLSYPEKISETLFLKDTIIAITKANDTCFIIKICNLKKDTVFLFDSYLNNELAQSFYLQRIDKENKVSKISFVPIIPFLSTQLSDVVILGNEKIVKKYQVIYSFKKIPPQSFIEIIIKKEIFNNSYCIFDFNANALTKFENPKFDLIECNEFQNFTNSIEFAIYENIDLLINDKAYYLDEFNFNKQAQSFSILTINSN